MTVLRNTFVEGNIVRFRDGMVSVPTQYIPARCRGRVVLSYMKTFGVGLREEVDVIFSVHIPDKGYEDFRFSGIPADHLQKA